MRIVLLALLVTTACASGRAGGPASRPNDPDARAWIDLFDGRSLAGWTPKIAKHDVGENFAETFRVRDGVIQARYDGYGGSYGNQFGHLYYDRPFSYYLLSLEYRFLGDLYPGAPSYTLRNSGVMIHSQDPRTMPRDQNFPISVEVQFLGGLGDGKARPTGNMCSPGTAVVFNGRLDPRHCINSTSKTIHGDAWVRTEVLVLGDSIVKTMIDGDTVLVYEKPQMAAGVVTGFDPKMLVPGKLLTGGFIALQAEGHPVDFRNVRVLNLEGCTDRRATNYKSYYVHSNPSACTYR
ncbi:protein of unknown function DUF1080 (plasmid) [Gemmatirosa kalamazoonensis]|uniref:3-keto-alpha-glucoside-1,2-lyase/3-keto-2-hydroxy-glucal hydratase domain-containing protein n=1 Tax=Gemmatirosa kalamazoonensis TaxID=861299 RepID=W0RUA4_9BACT|nr:DUF1080 domain-containing protein [Gemmatirosa kalamazoonensis]AHG93163.1 protein of unknown function DUF1080 [Gemmatirosa kalamazoonensis]